MFANKLKQNKNLYEISNHNEVGPFSELTCIIYFSVSIYFIVMRITC